MRTAVRLPRTDKILAGTPMKRFGDAEELIGGVLFLLSKPAASFVTGVVLPIDGGFFCLLRRIITGIFVLTSLDRNGESPTSLL